MSLHASFSNRLEALFDALLARLDATPRDPFTRDTLIVPSAAVQRWLLLRLAAQRGIAANLDMLYLAPWLHGLLRAGDEPEPLGAAWPWRVYEWLGHPRLLQEQPRLAQSLGDPAAPGAEALRWERAQLVAAQLERLGLERPDWLAAWRERRLLTGDPDEAWLAALWRAVGDEAGDLLARRLAQIGQCRLQGPVHLFALPRIAPLHWQALQGLNGELYLYQLNPCRAYWFDLVSPRRLAYLRELGKADAHEVGHPLLALNAQGSQQQLLQLAEAGLYADEGDYREPEGEQLLARFQRGLLELEGEAPAPAAPGDRSLELHVCHSLRRELEVLHDRLLGLIAADPGLQLADIQVLCPDLETAAPLIDAVFGSMPAERTLPYAISGQAEPPLPAALQRLIAVLALLDSPAPQAQFAGLLALLEAEETLDALLSALQAAGHHAGLDAAHAARHGLSPAHTLDAALQRLLLAYCLPARSPATAALPPLGPWRAAPQTLGQAQLADLQSLCQGLIEAAAASASPQPPAFWAGWLRAQAERWLPAAGDADSEAAESGLRLRDAIARLEQAWQRAGLRSALPLGRVRAALLDALHDPVRGGVAGGAISFSNLASLAPLPARVIAVIGLDDKAWPRPASPEPSDLLAKAPRPGDRRPRAEQRELLLQALLNAREVLHLSYSGRSQRDGSALPPSVMLAELLDWLGDAGRGIVVEQPLQPFSPLAFQAQRPRLQSFRSELLPPARGSSASLAAERDDDDEFLQPEPAFLPRPLPAQAPPERCTLAELQQALEHPARAWLRRRLNLQLPWDEQPWQDAEPFALDGFALRDWVDEFGEQLPTDPADPAVWARSDPRWPGGALGEAQLQAEREPLRRYAAQLAQWRAAQALPPCAGSLGLQVQGRALQLQVDTLPLREIDGRPSLLRPRYAKPRAADWLALWLRQLALNALLGPEARAIGLQRGGERLGFRSPEQPLALLQGLAELAFADPAPLLPLRSAWELLENGEAAAHKRWFGDRFPGESADAHWQLLLRGRRDDPLEGLASRAEALLGPLLAHRQGDA